LGLDGGEAKFYVYIQSTTMERPDLERTMEHNLQHDEGGNYMAETETEKSFLMERVLPENKTNYYSSWFW
jgi:hypothetical protein